MYTDLTEDEISVLKELFRDYINSKNELSYHGTGVENFLNTYKNLHKKGYIRITPLCLLEMSAEEWANSNIELHYETLDKAKPFFDEYQKRYTP